MATGEVNTQGNQLIVVYGAVEVERLLIFCLLFAVAGVLHSEPEALRLAQAIAETEGVELTGVYAHCGNTYNCRGVEQIQAVAQETANLTLQFVEKYDKSEKKRQIEANHVMQPATENAVLIKSFSKLLWVCFRAD